MKTITNSGKWSFILAIVFSLFAWTTFGQENNTVKLTDPEIASIAVTTNQIDVDYGKIALRKSGNAEVKKFAQTMINDHNGVIKQATDLANKLGVVPKNNETTRSLLKNAQSTTTHLNTLKGKAFDKAYVDNEVAYHEAVIATVKNVLIPQTSNLELKSLLQSVMPVLEHHLEMAKQAQSHLK